MISMESKFPRLLEKKSILLISADPRTTSGEKLDPFAHINVGWEKMGLELFCPIFFRFFQ
jgi:hypothetical protein